MTRNQTNTLAHGPGDPERVFEVLVIGGGAAGVSAAFAAAQARRNATGIQTPGREILDQAIGVLATNAVAAEQALLFRQWSDDVTLFVHEGPEPTDDEWEKLAARGIAVVTGAVCELRVHPDRPVGVTLSSGHTLQVDALAIGAPARSNLLATSGMVAPEGPGRLGTTAPDASLAGGTSEAGVWVTVNVDDIDTAAITAALSARQVGVTTTADLVAVKTAAVAVAGREPFSVQAEAQNSRTVLGNRRHGLETAN
ncbi:hypothetical protein E3T28_12500 [Cryobacterium sinapicolor]|uniref:FAD/NAD(P)-binding domain-containing protein n=1 Tax=Cryobacterium sinapicolor TaxID=1259236 RepID=A0ABY2J052_9MICO|nr:MULTISPECIES: hypothetical protein [Cryobacterium]TFC90544.1 hypothetical protein E3O67_05630 [Cryobacterium sp. TMT3-29-2]TFC96535.1 hypothetical protein E3T28_12500 [Cryobacterium sinapicolor]